MKRQEEYRYGYVLTQFVNSRGGISGELVNTGEAALDADDARSVAKMLGYTVFEHQRGPGPVYASELSVPGSRYRHGWIVDVHEKRSNPTSGSRKIYVGALHGGRRVVFRSSVTPTEATHGSQYRYVIGPFRTAAAANLMVMSGEGNVHIQTVADAERAIREQGGDR